MKTTLKNQLLAVFAVSAILLFSFSGCKKDAVTANNDLKKVTITLTSAQEVPATGTTGTGTGQISYDPVGKIITYNLTWTLGSASSTTTNMHFHGAEDGSDTKSSAVVIGITGFTTASSGTVAGTTRPLTDVEVAQLLAGKWYFNVHSSAFPNGEIRGNIKF